MAMKFKEALFSAINAEEEAGTLKAKEATATRDTLGKLKDANLVVLSLAVAHWLPKFRSAADLGVIDWASHIDLVRKFVPLIRERYAPLPVVEDAPVAEDDDDLPHDHPKKKKHHAAHH